MCARTPINADEASQQRREELQQLRAANALADHHRATGVHAVDLKNRLRDIETDRANLAHGRLPSKWFVSTQPPYGTLMPPSGAVHSIISGHHAVLRPCPLCPPKADIGRRSRHVRLVPGADSCATRKKDDAPFRLRASLI